MDVVDETDNITLHSRGLTLGPALLTRQVRLSLSNRKLTRVKVESSGERAKHKLRNRTKFVYVPRKRNKITDQIRHFVRM